MGLSRTARRRLCASLRLGRLRLFDSMRPLYKSAKTTYLGKYATTINVGR